MTGDNLDLEVKVEPAPAVVVHVLARKVYRYLHRHRYGIVDEHEPLQGLMTLLVIGAVGNARAARRVAWFSFLVTGGRISAGNFDERCPVS